MFTVLKSVNSNSHTFKLSWTGQQLTSDSSWVGNVFSQWIKAFSKSMTPPLSSSESAGARHVYDCRWYWLADVYRQRTAAVSFCDFLWYLPHRVFPLWISPDYKHVRKTNFSPAALTDDAFLQAISSLKVTFPCPQFSPWDTLHALQGHIIVWPSA